MRDVIIGGWRKLHNKELHNLYSLSNIIRMIRPRKMRWACTGEKRNVYRILVGKPEGKRPLGRLRCRWEDNIKFDLREVRWGGVIWIDLAQDRGSYEHGNEPLGSIKCWEILE
jgi:hypothetical protein